ncbi:hypothetical protein CU098_003424 [Rhizopus stolonifer]|uniref:PHD-type domain-containing protein n=1 Tax=Rhizopus stolonifer TaxID=4846 RepID=A0A367J590_RHIST|nr:hypothetical protein CU098_003424 [Rhizopus stolonifer]
MKEENIGVMSEKNVPRPSSYSPLALQTKPFHHLPLRKRPPMEGTFKKHHVETQWHQTSTYPPGSSNNSHSASMSSFKKTPLKKAYPYFKSKPVYSPNKNQIINPLFNPVHYQATEQVIHSFKAAWLHSNETKKPAAIKKTSADQKKTTSKSHVDGKKYCVCQTCYDATKFMIACDRCDDWFHGECIGIDEKESEFIDLYFCDTCWQVTGKKTSWKPTCANPNCLKPANSGHLSKYCSDSCGLQVARARLEWIEIKRRNHSIPIAEFCLARQRQLRIHSFADRQDRQRLVEIRQEAAGIRDKLELLNTKKSIAASNTTLCGFDSRFMWPDALWKSPPSFTVCQGEHCTLHPQWQELMLLVLVKEKNDLCDQLIRLEKEKNQIKARMRKRRHDQDHLLNTTLEI